jgi:hypothetical protein
MTQISIGRQNLPATLANAQRDPNPATRFNAVHHRLGRGRVEHEAAASSRRPEEKPRLRCSARRKRNESGGRVRRGREETSFCGNRPFADVCQASRQCSALGGTRVLVTCARDRCSTRVFGSGYCVVCERELAATPQQLRLTRSARRGQMVLQRPPSRLGVQLPAETAHAHRS